MNLTQKSIIYFFLLSLSCATQATTILYRSLFDLIDTSDDIITGEVVSIHSTKDELTETIYTIVELANGTLISARGEITLTENIKIRYKGGVVDIIQNGTVIGQETLRMSGGPKFETGEKLILFLTDNGQAPMPLNGLTQGFFRIDNNDYIYDYRHQPVVGISEAHIQVMTPYGVISKDKMHTPLDSHDVSNNRHDISNNTVEENQDNANEQDLPYVISSEYGNDVVLARSPNQAKDNNTTIRFEPSSLYSALTKTSFLDLIIERQQSSEHDQEHPISESTRERLHQLPAIHS